MSVELTAVISVFMVFVTIASGGALFVSMKMSSSLNTFRKDLVTELDARYVLKNEHQAVTAMAVQLDEARRAASKDRLDGVEVELHRYRDDLDMTLKGILTAIKETKKN